MGSNSQRYIDLNEHYPSKKAETCTALGLLCRFELGQVPKTTPILARSADLMLKTLPEWDSDDFGCDMCFWYFGSPAMLRMGGKHWKRWNKAVKPALLDNQRRDGHAAGSWDPVGPWGSTGGRVYSTALLALCLEVYSQAR